MPEHDHVAELAIDTSSAAVGALVGLAIGGPVGAVLGGAASPIMAKAGRVAMGEYERRRARAEALVTAGLGEVEAGLDELEANEARADAFMRLIRQAVDSDPALDAAFASILRTVVSGTDDDAERAAIVGDSLRGMRNTHLRILVALAEGGGELAARELAQSVGFPEIELRGPVRELETRGMIKDLGVHPIRWKIRELGYGVVRFVALPKKENNALPE